MVTENPHSSETAKAGRGEWTSLLLSLLAVAFAAFALVVPGAHPTLPLLTALALGMLAFLVGMRSWSQPSGIAAAWGAGVVIVAVVWILGVRVVETEWAASFYRALRITADDHRVQRDAAVESEAEADANEGTSVE